MNILSSKSIGEILGYLENFSFSRINKTYKERNSFVISEVAKKYFKYLKEINLEKIFPEFLKVGNKSSNEDREKIFKKILFYTYKMHKTVDKKSFKEIQLIYEKGSFELEKIKNVTKKIIDFIDSDIKEEKIAKFYKILSKSYEDQKLYKKALKYCDKAIDIFKNIKKIKEAALFLKDRSEIFYKMRKQKDALDSLIIAARFFYLANDKKEAVKNYNLVINSYENGSIKESLMIGEAYRELGLIYQKSNDIKKAQDFFNKASKIFKNFNNIKEALCYKDIALLYLKNFNKLINLFKKNYMKKSSLGYLKKSCNIFKKKGNIEESIDCKLKIVEILEKTGKYQESLSEYKKIYKELLKTTYKKKLYSCCKSIADIFFKQGKREEALIFFEKSIIYFSGEKIPDTYFNFIKNNYKNKKYRNSEIFRNICMRSGKIHFENKKYEKSRICYKIVGDIFYGLKQKESAKTCYMYYAKAFKDMAKLLPEKLTLKEGDSLRNGIRVIERIGDLSLEFGKKQDAIDNYLYAANISCKISLRQNLKTIRLDYDLFFTSKLYKKIAKIYREEKMYKEAKNFENLSREMMYCVSNHVKSSCNIL